MAEFTMPSLGADMDEGTLLEWLVEPGDVVHKGDVVAVVDTSKAAVEVETFTDGVVEKLLVEPGTTVPVGTPLAMLAPTDGHLATAPPAPAAAAPEAAPVPGGRSHPHGPLVRRLARELGVDPTSLAGTGPHGEVTKEDVVRAASARAVPPPSGERGPDVAGTRAARGPQVTPYARRLAEELGVDLATVPPPTDGVVRAAHVRAAAATPQEATGAPTQAESTVKTGPLQPMSSDLRRERMRATIASVMSRSKRDIPHYYLSSTVDLAPALEWMRARNRELSVEQRLVPAALMLKATALAAVEVPELNGFWVDGAFERQDAVHLGVAISLRGGGLVAPALHDAAHLSLDELMAAMRDLVTRARAGRLRGAELRDPTLTVTNLGEQGVESVLGVIYPPQVALVGFGAVVERPWAVDGLLGVRPLTTLTLSADHRATDGFVGSRFLAAVDRLLQRPEEL